MFHREITLWFGLFLVGCNVFQGFQFLAILSPLIVYILLNHVSGIPMLEKASDEKWGQEPAYIAYKKDTPILFPFIGVAGDAVPPPVAATDASKRKTE